jgi:hypothetical protein
MILYLQTSQRAFAFNSAISLLFPGGKVATWNAWLKKGHKHGVKSKL